ncbi:MAG: methylamine dehydrogenase [Steroidobacteraceae bacterium]
MLEILMISQTILLVLILLLGGLLFATIRQLGVLYERVAPLGALTLPNAVSPGDAVSPLSVVTLDGHPLMLGGKRASDKAQMLLFISPSCPMCKQVLGLLRSFARAEAKRLDIVLIGDGTREAHTALVREHGLGEVPLVLDSRVGLTYRIGKLPYAMLIDPTGELHSAGLINSREHLESLIVAHETGVASLQDYLHTHRSHAVQGIPGAVASSGAMLKGDVG